MFAQISFARTALIPAFLLLGCTTAGTSPNPPKPTRTAEISQPAPAMSDIKEIAPEARLESGHIIFQGMVLPTKGGYLVRGVVVEDDLLPKALANAAGNDGKNAEWFLGAIVRITGLVVKHEDKPMDEDAPVAQKRAGTFFQLERLDAASVVKPAEMIEGTLERSKGFFALGEHLISKGDIAWSLAPQGGGEGDKVRLFGQSRRVVCEPNTQCLIEGSLPIFEVGRAERLP